jgi:hypothetical protein
VVHLLQQRCAGRLTHTSCFLYTKMSHKHRHQALHALCLALPLPAAHAAAYCSTLKRMAHT